MHGKMLGFFSGFPAQQFPADIARRLKEALPVRSSLVFVSAWPADFDRNDQDAAGMHGMFTQYDMGFAHFTVIDDRTEVPDAGRLIRNADCIFLMGGNATAQFRLICEKDIAEEIRSSNAVILGVSAGSCNMAAHALDIWESHIPYAGLGLADITIKAHVTLDHHDLLETLRRISALQQLPICAMEDDSAIFVQHGQLSCTGRIHFIQNGKILPFSPELLCQ